MSDDEMYDENEEELLDEEEDEEDAYSEDGEPLEPEEEDIEAFKAPALSRNYSFEIIPNETLITEYKKFVQETMEVLGLPSQACAAVLLKHLKWNKEKLIDSYASNPDKICSEAGIPGLELKKDTPNTTNKFPCAICLEEVPYSNTFALGCGHRYCKPCWRDYLEVKLNEGPGSVNSTCAYPRCKCAVHGDMVVEVCTPASKEWAMWQRWMLRSFVNDNPRLKYCPKPGCENVVRSDRQKRKESVLCLCGFSFCFNCNDFNIGDHMPATCDMVERWNRKASDESENVTWLMANTKKCPECRSPIEKNGGCMHMTCNKAVGGCGHEFCWLCRGKWSEHGQHTGGYYDCNKYDKSQAKKEDTKMADVKTELEQYMFFYHRYDSHKGAGKIAVDQRGEGNGKVQSVLAKFDVRSTDTKFLMEATEQLIKNRRVLQFSYVYGYYNTVDKAKSTDANLFVYLQEDLEKHTNHLSELYEQPIDNLPDYQAFIKWKEEVANYTRVTKKFLDNFVEGVMTGLSNS